MGINWTLYLGEFGVEDIVPAIYKAADDWAWFISSSDIPNSEAPISFLDTNIYRFSDTALPSIDLYPTRGREGQKWNEFSADQYASYDFLDANSIQNYLSYPYVLNGATSQYWGASQFSDTSLLNYSP